MPKPTTSKIINGTAGNDTLFGDTSGTGKGAAQTINGLAGDDILYGDAFSMRQRAQGGNDSLNGGDGDTTIIFTAMPTRCTRTAWAVTTGSRAGVASTATPT
jgi:Ca2+-binding RTX toxin-like protein